MAIVAIHRMVWTKWIVGKEYSRNFLSSFISTIISWNHCKVRIKAKISHQFLENYKQLFWQRGLQTTFLIKRTRTFSRKVVRTNLEKLDNGIIKLG